MIGEGRKEMKCDLPQKESNCYTRQTQIGMQPDTDRHRQSDTDRHRRTDTDGHTDI